MENKLALIQAEDLSLVGENSLNEKQLAQILKKTPTQYIKHRPAKGGGTWEYVSGGYVKKCLNIMFGWDWDFEILEHTIQHGEAIVKGRLTCRSNGKTIIKTQFGNKDIICKKGTSDPLSIGNDLKAAATDCLKKCASEIGIAADIYNKEDFRETKVDTNKPSLFEVIEIFNLKKENMSEDAIIHCERIIKNEEEKSYKKLITQLKSI